jgi:FkbM family methyltransferase
LRALLRLAARAADLLGRDSGLVRRLRPWYERLLFAASGGRGIAYEINGVSFRVDPRHRDRLGHVYDAPVAAFLREHVAPGATCVNVGANVGVYVLQFANWSAPNGRVIAFEPNPSAARVLRRHVSMNGLSDRVEIVQEAVAGQPGTAEMHVAGAAGMGRLGSANPALEGSVDVLHVPVTTLDEFIGRHGLEPDWLFIDIEGFEWHAIAGAEQLIRRAMPRLGIVVELHPNAWRDAGSSLDEARSLLAKLRVTPRPLTNQTDPLRDHGIVHLAPLPASEADA